MKNIIILELLLALLVLLLGESLFDIRKEEFQGETLKIAYTKDIGDVDPFDSGSPMFVQDWVYEGLVGMQNGKAVPKLAESWGSQKDCSAIRKVPGKKYSCMYLKCKGEYLWVWK